MIATYEHLPVMQQRIVELLEPALTGTAPLLVDATIGLGGHSEALLKAIDNLTVIGLDRDAEALERSRNRLSVYGDRVILVHARYDRLGEALDTHAPNRSPQGILFDLGVSSLHLDKPERGFAYSVDAPLDMRMDQSDALTAADIVRTYSAQDLTDIFQRFGDEKLARRYADTIVAARSQAPIERTSQLVDILQSATPYALKDMGHPAKRVFQALRIEVNQELDSLYRALPVALDRLEVGGRIVVMSYQSGEDRFVKNELRRRSQSSAPLGLPTELPQHRPEFREITRGAERASEAEMADNPRATPVRVRAAEKLRKVDQ